jgi:SpoVK/Ycf46/Vps4 family AAA+-type ATPase
LVGETERNIATVFSQAEEEDAVLLLDEADSFLQERRGAQRQWEVTGVNQMLTCMESFDGVFIASTNLLDQMDMASLRRFDAKILFDYLKPEQVLRFFASLCRQLGLANDPKAEATVASLGVLTPGDFAALLRQSRLVPIDSGRELARRLSEECSLKPNGRRAKIGFN